MPLWTPAAIASLISPGARMSTNRGTSVDVPAAESAEHQTTGSPAGRANQQPSEAARYTVLQAQAVLVGLTGCPPDSAAEALRRVAEVLHVPPASLAHRLLHSVDSPDHDAKRLLASVGRTALAAALEHSRAISADHMPPARAVPIVSGDVRGVIVTGEIDIATTALLDGAVLESCSAAGTRRRSRSVFLLNLADVTFLDARALTALAKAQEQAEASGYRVRAAPPIAPGPRRVLQLAVDRGWLDPLYRPADDRPPTEETAAAIADRKARKTPIPPDPPRQVH
jgi:anti-anti-sigma regulatory factor